MLRLLSKRTLLFFAVDVEAEVALACFLCPFLDCVSIISWWFCVLLKASSSVITDGPNSTILLLRLPRVAEAAAPIFQEMVGTFLKSLPLCCLPMLNSRSLPPSHPSSSSTSLQSLTIHNTSVELRGKGTVKVLYTAYHSSQISW